MDGTIRTDVAKPSFLQSDRVALSCLLAVGLVFFFPILRGDTFSAVAGHHVSVYPWRAFDPVYYDNSQTDQADLSYPWQAFLTTSVRSGVLPLWNPYSYCGQPFFANGSSAVLYPPKLLAALLFDPAWAHDALTIFHVLLAGIAMWLFLRDIGLSPPPALLGGIAWMLCPFHMAWLQLEVVAPSGAWLPVGCLLAHRAIARRSWRYTIATSAALACALVGGHLLFMALVYGVVTSYAAVLTFSGLYARQWRGVGEAAGRLAVIAIGPLMLASAVLIPTVLFIRGLARESLSYQLAHEQIRVAYGKFAHLLIPSSSPRVTVDEMHEMAYVGRLVAILAVIGFATRFPIAWFGRVLTVVTFLIATDTILLKWIYAVVPQFSFFSPLGRLLNFFDFGVIILGSAGFEALLQWLRKKSRFRFDGAPTDRRGKWIQSLTIPAVVALVVGVTAVELTVYGRQINPEFAPREPRFDFPRTPLITRLAAELNVGHNGPGRMIPIRQTMENSFSPPILSANESMLFGFESAAGWDSTSPDRAETLLRIVAGQPVEFVLSATYRRSFWPSFDVAGTRFDLVPRLGVTTIVAAPEVADDPLWEPRRDASGLKLRSIYSGIDGHVYRIAGASGGPVVAWAPRFVGTSRQALDLILSPEFDHRKQVVFETNDVPVAWRGHANNVGNGSAVVVSKMVNTEEVELKIDQDAWVVVPTNWDAGWSARVDGEVAPVIRANYTFQAVPVRAGQRRLRLSYRPRGLPAGLAVSVLTMVVALFIVVRPRQAVPEDRAVVA